MKIFTTESVIESVSRDMESNLIKNAHDQNHAYTNHKSRAIDRLVEAAELYEQVNSIKKANVLRNLIAQFEDRDKVRVQEIEGKISFLCDIINKLGEVSVNDLNWHFISSAENKIHALLSQIVNTNGNVIEALDSLKNNYKATPQTLRVISESLDVANGTLNVVAGEKKTKKKKVKEPQGDKVMHHFGFTDLNYVEDEEDKSWED